VLFSSDTVATYINNTFEPVWESVRPVPIVTIDFGNGHTITRTLHGNIATYLCGRDGTVYDILPGIYDPAAYQKQLEQFALLHVHARQQFFYNGPQHDGEAKARELAAYVDRRLKAYHEQQARWLAMQQPAGVLEWNRNGGRGKEKIERLVELVAAGGVGRVGYRPGANPGQQGQQDVALPAIEKDPVPTKSEEIAGWNELVEDTRINESMRRRAIHEKLATAGRVQSADIKKWLFKAVLAADLDDPTLGIGDLLNKRYPFAEEDAKGK
jgi:hypothetical protein